MRANAKIIKDYVTKALGKLTAQAEQFDLIFIDPPYKINHTELKGILETLSRERLIRLGGTIVLEHSSKVAFSKTDRLIVKASKKYGDTCLTFYSPT